MLFRLAIVVSSNPINFTNAHSLHQRHTPIAMRIVKWIIAHKLWYAEMAFIHGWKWKISGLDIVSKNLP